MSVILAFLLPLLYLLSLTGLFIYIFKKKFNFQFLLPIAIVASTLFIYFFTLIFHHITAGIIITIVAAAAFIPLVVLDKNRRDTLRKLFFTPAFLIFVLLYTFLFVFHYNTIPQLFSDDTMHWAPHVWTMWMRDDFYTSPGLSIVVHGDYQPILQLFQLTMTKLSGVYNEGFLYIALEITCFAMIFPVLKNLVWKKKETLKTIGVSLLILTGFLALPATLDVTHLFYNALHPDYAIAFVFVLGVYLAVTESRKFSWVSAVMLSLVVTFLCLTKQSSILFGGLVGLIYAAGLYHSYRPKPKVLVRHFLKYIQAWRKNWQTIILAIALLVLPFVALKLWQVQTKGFESPYCCVAIFHISPSDALKVPSVLLKDSGNESQQNYARGFLRYVMTYQAGFTTQFISNVSYMQFVLLFIGAMVFIGYNYKDKFRRSKLIIVTTIIVGGWFLYCFAIYLTFLFGGMIDSERDNLLTGDRYLRTYIFAMLLILFLLLISFIVEQFNRSKKLASKTIVIYSLSLIAVLCLLFNIDILKNGYLIESLKFKTEYSDASISDPGRLASTLRTFTASVDGTYENPKKFAVIEHEDVKTSYLLRYHALPNKIENGSDIVFNKLMTQDKLCGILERNEFLFVNYAYDEQKYIDMINECITNDIDSFTQYQAFKIEKDGDKLRLVEWKF